MMLGDEAYAGSRNFYHLEAAIQRYYGYTHLVPTHQGRGAEHLISQIAIKPGEFVPGNMYFTTTRLHQELAGGIFVDVIRDEAHDPESLHPFKGNVDLDKLEALVARARGGADPLRLARGHRQHGRRPAGLDGKREGAARLLRRARHPPLPRRDAGGRERLVHPGARGGVRRDVGGGDPAGVLLVHRRRTMSAKKDSLVNIGGWLALNDRDLFEEARNLVVVYEGLHTYGGLAGRDMEAMAIGIEESVQDDHMRARIGQVEYLGELLEAADVPIVRPIGGHAIFLDARRFYPHLPQDAFPAQTLAAELYLDSGIRSMERGIVSAGRDPKTGEHHYPKLELVRLTIPRRVYTQAHMDVVAESVETVYAARDSARGLKLTYEPSYLRFFQARFEPL